MRHPVAYLRKSKVSSDRHVSWDVQEGEIRAMATRSGDAELLIFLSDWGRSGRGEKTRLRPEYLRLRAMIEADEVSVLYSYSLSRLARSLGEYANLAELCQAHGVRVRLAKEGEFDYASASGRFAVGILALLAQMEAELAQERARDTIAVRRARGDHVGSAGFGQRLVHGQLRDEPKEDLSVVEAAYREARSFAGAARILNSAGVLSKEGRAWSQTTVSRLLRRDAPEELVGRLVERGVAQRGSFALSRLLRCPCGNLMTGRRTSHTTKYGSYGPYISYQCYRGRYEPGHPRPYMISEEVVMPWIQAEAARLKIPASTVAVAEEDANERDRLTDRRLRVIDNFESGLFDKAERDRKLLAIAEELEGLSHAEQVLTIPTLDWSWPAPQLNTVLRSLWRDVKLGSDLRPVKAHWLVPKWRSEVAV